MIERYHLPATPYARALAHPKLPKAIKRRLRETYRTLDPVLLLAEMRRCQEELGSRIDARGIKRARRRPVQAAAPVPTEVGDFARTLGTLPFDTTDIVSIEPRATHRKPKRRYKTRMRMPSKLDPHLATIEGWLAAEPNITALTIVRRLAGIDATTFGDKQHSIVQRLLRAMRRKQAETLMSMTELASTTAFERPGPVDGAARDGPSAPPTGPPAEPASTSTRDHKPPGNIPS